MQFELTTDELYELRKEYAGKNVDLIAVGADAQLKKDKIIMVVIGGLGYIVGSLVVFILAWIIF